MPDHPTPARPSATAGTTFRTGRALLRAARPAPLVRPAPAGDAGPVRGGTLTDTDIAFSPSVRKARHARGRPPSHAITADGVAGSDFGTLSLAPTS